MDFDDLHFGSSAAAQGGQDAFCLGCMRSMQVHARDRLCPTCGLPLRRIAEGERGSLQRMNELQTRIASLVDSGPARDVNREGQQDEDDDEVEAEQVEGQPISRSELRRQQQEEAGRQGAAPFDLGSMLEAMMSGSGPDTAGGSGGGGGLPAGVSDAVTELRQLMSTMLTSGTAAGQGGGADTALLGQLQEQLGMGLGMEGPVQGIDGTGMPTLPTPGHKPTSPAAIAALRRFMVKNPATDLPQTCTLKVSVAGSGGEGTCMSLDMVALPAAFGPRPPPVPAAVTGHILLAQPLDGSGPRIVPAGTTGTAAACTGSIVLAERGVVSFANKALKAQSAGAAAIIVANQRGAAWPYTMTDSAGESSSGVLAQAGIDLGPAWKGKPLAIPCAMVRAEDGQRLKHLAAMHGQDNVALALCGPGTGQAGLECSVCCEPWHGVHPLVSPQGEEALSLPCGHAYHGECILAWLKTRNTCPLCRASLPAATEEELDAMHNSQGANMTGQSTAASAGAARFRNMQRDMEQAMEMQRQRDRISAGWYT